jgi:hypothetical protein
MVMLDRLTVVFVFNTNLSYLNPAAAFNLKFHLDDVSASTRDTALQRFE